MIKKFVSIFLLIVILFGSSSTIVYAKKVKTLTQLERREMETRFFDTSDTEKVIKAAVNTLQDSGFIIQEIEPNLGYIRASKSYKRKFINKGRVAGQSFMLALFAAYAVFSYGSTAYYVTDPTRRISNELHAKTVVVDTNVNVDKFGKNKTKVRIVFSQKVLQNADGYSYVKSAPTRVLKVYDPKVYQEFFAQLDKSIFYEGI